MTPAERIAEFVERQYVCDVGDVRENVEALFAADLAYHADGEVLGREDLIDMGAAVRDTDRSRRRFSLTDWQVEGSTVRWHLSAHLPGMGEGGGDVRQESEVEAVFGGDGLVHVVWSRSS